MGCTWPRRRIHPPGLDSALSLLRRLTTHCIPNHHHPNSSRPTHPSPQLPQFDRHGPAPSPSLLPTQIPKQQASRTRIFDIPFYPPRICDGRAAQAERHRVRPGRAQEAVLITGIRQIAELQTLSIRQEACRLQKKGELLLPVPEHLHRHLRKRHGIIISDQTAAHPSIPKPTKTQTPKPPNPRSPSQIRCRPSLPSHSSLLIRFIPTQFYTEGRRNTTINPGQKSFPPSSTPPNSPTP